MSRITTMDATGALVLKDAIDKLDRRGIAVMRYGVQPARCRALTSSASWNRCARPGREYATAPEAIAGARAPHQGSGVLSAVPPQPPFHGHGVAK